MRLVKPLVGLGAKSPISHDMELLWLSAAPTPAQLSPAPVKRRARRKISNASLPRMAVNRIQQIVHELGRSARFLLERPFQVPSVQKCFRAL